MPRREAQGRSRGTAPNLAALALGLVLVAAGLEARAEVQAPRLELSSRDGRSTLHVAAVEDVEEQEALRQRLGAVGLLEGEHELSVGFNVYLFSQAIKLGADGSLLAHQRTDGNRYGMVIQLQAQLAF